MAFTILYHKKNLNQEHRPILFLILIALFIISRFAFLEVVDLIDPTEARYAVIAAEMVSSSNWLVPSLPMTEGLTPYMGKPPLHFWLTSLSYKIFGIDEWSSRLPSFISGLLCLWIIFQFTKKYASAQKAILAVLVCLSSAMFFFIMGASVTDMTLTLFVNAALYFFARTYLSANRSSLNYLLIGLFSAGAFLTKGPVAIVLIGLPVLLFLFFSSRIKELKFAFNYKIILTFFIVIVPWFLMAEVQNPGFLKYFIWNENIGRYLFKNYGDLYGSGHVYSHGVVWLMWFAAFIPWSCFTLYSVYKRGFKETSKEIRANQVLLFVFVSGVSAPLFFTFVRQLHALYILPSIPFLSVFTVLFSADEKWLGLAELQNLKKSIKLPIFVVVLAILLFLYTLSQTIAVGVVNNNRSTEKILATISEISKNYKHSRIPSIGVRTTNTYSHYWSAKAWMTELKMQLKISYIKDLSIPATIKLDFILLSEKDLKSIEPENFLENFYLIMKSGKWNIFMNKNLMSEVLSSERPMINLP